MTASAQSDSVVLYGVPVETYRAMVDILADCRFPHCYTDGALEAPRILTGVAPEAYRALLDAWADYGVRHTYWNGVLEMMSPRKDHDWVKKLIARMIEYVATRDRIPIQGIGSTTLSSEHATSGIEPDEAYYVANELTVRAKSAYEPDVDPPPDLTIEVDVTSSSLPRMRNFAAIGIPEVWRHDGKRLEFLQLRDGEYHAIECSIAFPKITPGDIERFLDRRGETDDTSLVCEFYDWISERPGE